MPSAVFLNFLTSRSSSVAVIEDEIVGTPPSAGESAIGVALDDLVEVFAGDHERDAAFARIGTLHRVHVAEARGAAEIPAPGRALDRIVGESVYPVATLGLRTSCHKAASDASRIAPPPTEPLSSGELW